MRSKLVFFILVFLTLLLLPIGVKSRQKVKRPAKERFFDGLEQIETRDELKGNSFDSDYLNKKMV
jgi:hypothetical protein